MNASDSKNLSRDSDPRYEFYATCSLTLADGNCLEGEATNISLGGIFLLLKNPDYQFELHQPGQLKLIANLKGKMYDISAPCKTVYREDAGVGIQFEQMGNETTSDLTQLVEELDTYNAFYSQNINRELKLKYNITAFFYDILDYPWERLYRKWRKKLLYDIHGRVLEMGVGTGRNFKYFHPSVQLTGIDLSERMLQRAERRGKTASCTVNLYKEDATNMVSMPLSHYDWLVSFFLCCVMPNRLQPLAILQIERVLKPGGQFRLLEMVYSKDPRLRRRQAFFAPFVEKIYGARFDRNTLGYLQQSQVLEITNTYFIKDDTYLIIEGRRKPVR